MIETDNLPSQTNSDQLSPAWSIWTRYFVLLLVTAATVWLAIIIAPLLEAVGIAILLALLLNPLVNGLMRKMSRPWAATLVFVLFLLLLLGLPVGMGSLAVFRLSELATDLTAALNELLLWLLRPIDIMGYTLDLPAMVTDLEAPFTDALTTLPRGSLNLLSNISANVFWTITIIVTVFYLLKDGYRVQDWFLNHVPPDHRPEMERLWNQVAEIWGKFLRIQLLLFLVLVILLALGTVLVVWLFRSGLLRWSPLGFILLLLAVYTAVQQVDNLWLRPQFMGRHLQLHPGIVFLSLIAGLAFGGLLGALVAVPAIATARILGRYIYFKIVGLPPEAANNDAVVEESGEGETAVSPPSA